jgi:hypothetical protein
MHGRKPWRTHRQLILSRRKIKDDLAIRSRDAIPHIGAALGLYRGALDGSTGDIRHLQC